MPCVHGAPPLQNDAVWKWRQGDKGGEWVVTTLLRALSLPLSKAGLGGVRRAQKKGEMTRERAPSRNWKATNLLDREVTQEVSRRALLFRSFRSLVPSSISCLRMLRDCTNSLDKTNTQISAKVGEIWAPILLAGLEQLLPEVLSGTCSSRPWIRFL